MARTMSWRVLSLALLAVLSGCDDRADRPNKSYIFPTAIIGVPVASPEEGALGTTDDVQPASSQ